MIRIVILILLIIVFAALLDFQPLNKYDSDTVDQIKHIQETLNKINDNLTYLKEVQDKRKLSFSFVKKIERFEKTYGALKSEAEGLSKISKKEKIDEVEKKADANEQTTSYIVNIFRGAPKNFNGMVNVRVNTLNRDVQVNGFYAKCRMVSEKYEENPEIKEFNEPSSPTPKNDWKPLESAPYDCWAVDTRDKNLVGDENPCDVGENNTKSQYCTVQVP